MCEKREAEGFLFGVAVGAIIGGVLGLLFAPDEGKKTRTRLKALYDDKKEAMGDLARDISEKVSEAREKAEPKLSEIKEKIEPILRKVEEVSEPVREQVEDYVSDLKDEISGEPSEKQDGDDEGERKQRFFKGIRSHN
ncbi:hypothetical protein A2716_04840 [candidate division WWE3 bacterium RIFCSPHIGHO2_01_FULL_40_23]|uniref:Gas vesicle protein n=1 Tax=candidate division WWE3 bacterium RIFCSPLOWO2_01_FULL_41_18 TaxID=1802625 RepID=A0A1F4VD46_UNCKA|nr:MAG: hypothetical protein A2716_04840 [candidate division WWE3 bacterium RIFCSPHIGHO2_01_FULL_40_23]OGC55196.1 MAG: hypothetical protein A3A78_04450 [candidate division WWE3 bacterium RIFCSPLOWO2_01_FULL_41_18]